MPESKENLKKRIDTNKNQHIENNEVDNFVKNKNNGDVDLNKLGEYLNNLPLYNNDELKKALNDFFRSPEWDKYNQEIKNKVKNNQPLNKTELSLLYLAMISDSNTHLSTKEQLNFDSNKPIDQICNGALIFYIREKYNSPLYTGKKVDIKLPNKSKKESVNPLDRNKSGGNIKLPDNIGEIKKNEADFYCNRLITRAEKSFPNEINKAKREIEHKHRYKDDTEKNAYIKRDILLIAFEKYTEAINKQHEKLITNSGYKDKNDFENQMKLIEEFGKEIQKKYPNIDEILSKIKKFDEEMKANEKKYFKNENETKKAEKNYEEFNKYIDKKSKEYNIDKIQDSLKKEPKTQEELEEYLHNMNKIFEFQENINKKNKAYGNSISKYQKYIAGAIAIQKKYNIQQYRDILEKYNQDISNWSKKIDFKKYENYKSGIDWKLEVGLKNINTLQGIITDPQNEYFPVKEIKDAERQKQIKQDGIDRLRGRIKRISPGVYWTLTTFTGLWNGLIDSTIGVSTSLGVMILGIIGGKDETLSQMDRKARRDNFFKISQSSAQKEAVYSSETGFNFNADNTVSTVASSISQMLTLIYGGGAIGSGATKVFGISESIAGRVGLFTSSFITQVGGSYQEAITHGLAGKDAIGYSFLSASIQSSLELISPNEVLLGKGNGIAKELIRNACNTGGKEGFMLIGKTFLKNVGLEIIEENIQEGLQTVAGNIINKIVNGLYGSKLKTDRSWKNFASTAIITTLTTGITTGVSTGIQMYEMSSQDQTKLIEYIKSDNGLYLEVTGMLDKAIDGKVSIPNVSIQQLQELKLSLTGNTSLETNIPGTNINNPSHHTNTDIIQTNYEITLPKEAEKYTQILGSKFHEERRQSRLRSDGTYEPRIEKTTDQKWISQHNGQTEVDIANTKFEDLPSNRKYENLEAAKVAIGLIFERVSKGEEITPKMIEEMSEIVHNKRLERNGTEGSFENQRVPYEQLTEEEKAKDRNQVLQAIETVKESHQTDYFDGKSHQFEVTENQARSNSEMMDNLLNEINENNKSKKLEELRKNISEQYKQTTGEELNLTDEQLLSILDAHEQDGELGELSLGQLKQKVKVLDETITDAKIRRFLLEAGFCGQEVTESIQQRSNVEKLKELGIKISWNIEKINNIHLDFEKINRIKNLGIKIDGFNIEKLNNIELDFELFEKLKNIGIEITKKGPFSDDIIENFGFLGITDKDIQFIQENHLTKYEEIEFALIIRNNMNRNVIQDYIHRKNEYLKNHRTISSEKFTELFGGKGKYGKTEINQEDIGICYAYTGFEMLKKSNCFNELIQTNLRESINGDGWEVRMPMGDESGTWVKINKNEIDMKIKEIDKDTGEEYERNINSKSDFLGFKILEIAFMKSYILRNYFIKNNEHVKKAKKEYEDKGDFKLTSELINLIEEGTIDKFRYMTINTNIYMKSYGSDDGSLHRGVSDSSKDLAFKYFNTGINIYIGLPKTKFFKTENLTQQSQAIKGDGRIDVFVHDVKIINKAGYNFEPAFEFDGDRIKDKRYNEKGERIRSDKMVGDLATNKDGKTVVRFTQGHAYSIEKCYIDKNTGEKRVWVINPRHTGLKFDISLEEAKSIFLWNVTGFNIDAMFRETTTNQESDNYFDGKTHQFNVTETQARGNSEMMDNLLNEINENNKLEKLQELRKNISEQYKQVTGEELNLTDEQLLSILDAHEQDGILGELTLGQLKQKVKILDETITDQKIRRFLLEAGFCGKEYNEKNDLENKSNDNRMDGFIIDSSETIEIEDIKDMGLTPEQIENLKKIRDRLGIKIDTKNIEIIKDIELTPKQIKNITKIRDELEIEIYIQDIERIKDTELTPEQTENLKKIKDEFGIDINARNIEKLKNMELTPEQTENLKKIKNLGIDINARNIEKLINIGLTPEQIENLKKIKDKLGIKIDIQDIGLTPKQIENIKKIMEIEIKIDVRDIGEIKNIELAPKQIENIKKLRDKLGIEIDARDIETIKDIELTPKQIENIKKLRDKLGIEIDAQDIETIKDIELTPEQIENIKKLRDEVGTNLESNGIKPIIDNIDILEIDNTNLYKGYNRSPEEIETHQRLTKGTIIERIQHHVQKTISENRNIGEVEIINEIRTLLITISKTERLKLLIQVQEAVNKFNTVRKYLDFKNGPYKSPKDLLCAIRGIEDHQIIEKISDDITVRQHGAGFMFFIGDETSYNWIYNINSSEDTGSGGFNIEYSTIPELEGTLSVVNGKDSNIEKSNHTNGTIWHEGQHNRNSYFMPDKDSHTPITRAKDEITAYLRDGRGTLTIEKILTKPKSEGGLYQYGLEGEARENHKKQVRELLEYTNDLIELTKDSKTGVKRENIISLLSDIPTGGRKDLHDNIMDAVRLHNQKNPESEQIQNLKGRFISTIKKRAKSFRIVVSYINLWNLLFPKSTINLKNLSNGKEFWWAGTATVETVLNELNNCNSIEEIKYILNDPQYSHIGRGPDNKGGIEVSAIIDEVVAGNRNRITFIPNEIRHKIVGLIN